jgi:hypothetical protein
VVRKRDGPRKPIMAGKVKDREVVACIISVFLYEHSNGRGSITMSDARL